MFKWSPLRSLRMNGVVSGDNVKRQPISREVGTWLYTKEVMNDFMRWCTKYDVRAYGNIKITGSNIHYARCLRVVKEIAPGQGIITCPANACFNFLTVAREMFDTDSASFPLQLNWMNYNLRTEALRSMCMFEVCQAGWMARIVSLDESPFSPYMHYLMQDTRGRDGVSSGLSKERGDEIGPVDVLLSEMATEAGEEPDTYVENFIRSFAILMLRSQPIEPEAIRHYINGTNFFKAHIHDMYVPTLMPLIDTVPQLENGEHNTIVEYVPFTNRESLECKCEELMLPAPLHGTTSTFTANADKQTLSHNSCGNSNSSTNNENSSIASGRNAHIHNELTGMNPELICKSGFFVLRALRQLDPGEVLYLRRYPREGGADIKRTQAQIMDANVLLSQDDR